MHKQERIFGISSNNKGLPCPFKPILCQEGYCHGCQIYLDWQLIPSFGDTPIDEGLEKLAKMIEEAK